MVIGITGASGFIGKALARAAKERGHRVVAYTRKPKNGGLAHADETRVIQPVGDKPALDPSGLDALVHLAGENVFGYWTPAKKRRIRDSRVDLTRRVVDAFQNCNEGPKIFVCGSAVGAYGDRGDEVLTESAKRGWGFLADVCAEWEREAARAATFGLRVVSLRTGMVLGPDGGTWPLLRRIFGLRLGSRLGDGRQWVPWIHIDDEVGIILHALESPAYNGPVNLTAPNPVTNAEMTRTIANLLNTTTFIPVPGFALRIVLGELGGVALDSMRAKPEAALKNGYEFKYTDLEHALAMCV